MPGAWASMVSERRRTSLHRSHGTRAARHSLSPDRATPGAVLCPRSRRGLGGDERPPAELDAAILLAPVGALVPKALADVVKGGVVVCGGIHMSDIPQFPYAALWGERQVCSVANMTRQDGREFIELAQRVPIRTTVSTFPLAQANEALAALRGGTFSGAAVLTMN